MKTCEYCGKEFEQTRPNRRYCCHECGIKAWRAAHPGCVARWAKNQREAYPERTRAATNRYGAKHREEAKERGRKHYKSHKDEVLARTKEWHKNNPEKTRLSTRKSVKKWRLANPEKQRESDRRYRAANPEKVRESAQKSNAKRAAAKRGNGGSFTTQEFLDLCKAHHWRCAYCGCALTTETVTVDHKIPLSRGGGSDIENIAPACKSCNSSKCDRTSKEYKVALELCAT